MSIKATPQAIWDAIMKPEWTERYGYGGRGEYDLRSESVGSTIAPVPKHGWTGQSLKGEGERDGNHSGRLQ